MMKLAELLPHFSKQLESVAVTVLESMMLINHGHYFEARRLPVEAQWSPAFSVHIGDAILQLETIKGMGPVREIHAGSGYGSNDGSIQVLGFNAEPKKLHVTWPGGKVTSHPVAPGTVEILIQSLHP